MRWTTVEGVVIGTDFCLTGGTRLIWSAGV